MTETKTGKHSKPLTDEWRSWLHLNVARGCLKQELLDKCVNENGFDKEEVQSVLGDMEEGSAIQQKKESISGKTMNNAWKEYLKLRLDQGASKEDLFLRCVREEHFHLDDVSAALGNYRSRSIESTDTGRPEFTKRTFHPRAWKLDTELLEIYEIPNFLTAEECNEVMQTIDSGILKRSVVTFGPAEFRTSQTCHLRIESEDGIIARVEQKLQGMMGTNYDPLCAETLQGQRYEVGTYFQAHTDWFTPNTEEYNTHCQVGGQRTWTVMVYLNNVEEGGETKFESILREFIPRQGLALAWNNLDRDGKTPNSWSRHEAMPVTKGAKYVLTKWFRERRCVM